MLLIFLHYETRFAISSVHLKTPANRAFFTHQPVKRIAECTEVSNYRNPLEVSPQVGISIEFDSMEAWRSYIESQDYIRIMRELRILGCHNFTAQIWAPSRYFPESLRPEGK